MPEFADLFHDADPWALQSEMDPILEKLVTDAQGTALLTAAFTSAVNAMRQPGVACSPSELQTYLPNPNGMMFALRVLDRQYSVPAVAQSVVSAFFAGLDPALRETERYFADTELIGMERAVAFHQFSLAQAWRNASGTAADAIVDLTEATQEFLPELYWLSAGVLVRLLRAAAQGQSPCLNTEGRPFLPALPQRRRAARRILGQPATVTAEGRTQRVFVRDVSQGGIGLERVDNNLNEDAMAVVALSTGRRFTGTVVWHKARRAGIRLTVALTPNDPLLWG